jgi:hypothetical protein
LPRSAESATTTQDSATEKRIQQLTAEGNSLRDILRNQSRPSNLAVIKAARTPILEKPIEGSKLLLNADAEDEFQIVDTAGDWVHVQVSGLSRGWVRRSEVDVPTGSDQSLSAMENDPRTSDRPPAFQETREEVSVFPGKWEPLDGKKVKIIWVQPSGSKSFGSAQKLTVLKSVLHKSYPQASSSTPPVAGIVIILDSEDGGMAAAPHGCSAAVASRSPAPLSPAGLALELLLGLPDHQGAHIWDFLQRQGFLRSPMELYGELELLRLLDQFFDRALYFVTQGYEQAHAFEGARVSDSSISEPLSA